MVKANRGTQTIEVVKSAYERIFKPQGFELVEDEVVIEGEIPAAKDESEDAAFLLRTLEKPISEWKQAGIKRFAALKGIDLTGTKSAAEAKSLIKDFLEKEEE